MNLELNQIAGLIGVGSLFGLGQSFLGIGGGLIMVPLVPLIVSVEPRSMIATSLMCFLPVSLHNALIFTWQRRVIWRISVSLGCASALTAWAAARATGIIPTWALHMVLLTVFAWLMAETFRKRMSRSVPSVGGREAGVAPKDDSGERGLWICVGLFGGILSGLCGIGSGIFMTPFLLKSPFVRTDKVVPTAVTAMVFTTLAGVTSFASESQFLSSGGLRVDLMLWLTPAAITTSLLGLRYQHRITDLWRNRLMLALLSVLACQTAFRLWKSV